MYSLIVTMTVREDRREAFEREMRALGAAVQANEPDALCYHTLRSRCEPTRYRVVEIYASKDAFKLHLAAAHVQAAGPRVQAMLSGAPEAEIMEVLD